MGECYEFEAWLSVGVLSSYYSKLRCLLYFYKVLNFSTAVLQIAIISIVVLCMCLCILTDFACYFYIRFETEAEKQKRMKEEAVAKEMANVSIAFKLSEPSPLYETVIPREIADPSNITVFMPKTAYTRSEMKSKSEQPPKVSTNGYSAPRPQNSKAIKKTIEVIHARPTTSPMKKEERVLLLSVPTPVVKQDTDNLQMITKTSARHITGNKINFETHVKETEAEKNAMPKSKRLVKMQFSSGSSNFRYADGLERSPAIKVISPAVNT